MTRTAGDEYRDGILFTGYDYTRQAWVQDGTYCACGHRTPCDCYGTLHQGEPSTCRQFDNIEAAEVAGARMYQ